MEPHWPLSCQPMQRQASWNCHLELRWKTKVHIDEDNCIKCNKRRMPHRLARARFWRTKSVLQGLWARGRKRDKHLLMCSCAWVSPCRSAGILVAVINNIKSWRSWSMKGSVRIKFFWEALFLKKLNLSSEPVAGTRSTRTFSTLATTVVKNNTKYKTATSSSCITF